MVEQPKSRSIVPAPDRGAIVESRLAERGLELLDNLEYTTVVPAAILVHGDYLLIVEDAAFRRESHEAYWDHERPRIFAVHRFSLDRREYYSTRVYTLPTIDEQIVNRTFVVSEDHLVVLETVNRLCQRPWHRDDRQWVEYVFTPDGELLTVLTDHPVLLAKYWEKNIEAKAVKVSDPQFRPFMGVASRGIAKLNEIDFNPFSGNIYSKKLLAQWESSPYIGSKDVFCALSEKPSTRELTIPIIPSTEHELYRKVNLPNLAFWEIDRGTISVSRGNLSLSASFKDVLNVDEATRNRARFYIEGDSELLLDWDTNPYFRDNNFLTYCWIENHQIKSLHGTKPKVEFAKLNQETYPKFRSSDIMVDSVLHHGILYAIVDFRFTNTSAIMAFDVHTSTVTTTIPKVPEGMSVMYTES